MDILLHDATSTAFMSTLDLKTGYHRIEINPADINKTAFLCPFDITRSLSYLTKKNIVWKWNEQEQQFFHTLKQCLITPPVLKQVDPTKRFIIRTEASAYALGVVLLQGENLADERPIDTEQLKDSELKKIIDCFENINKNVDFANGPQRGYILNQEVLYCYSPHSEGEEAQLVVPFHEREKGLKIHHDAPTATHDGADRTLSRISSSILDRHEEIHYRLVQNCEIA
ncbi:Transposon Tf2-9 polyprotein like [Argiope bruennichi]|uniref:Transposon Tf2-9 polyprotein like n=1 Tax=Argiope bruennichi TaxID=94029 RepID=A0A8T0E0U0_ARGBR|nr:Transposon Tf2-9 polyprotein like [Argiope bruennichi]